MTTRFRFVLPLPRFILHPLTAVGLAAVHVYLAAGHLTELATGNVEWTHLWKGFGALFGAYVFAALALRGLRPEAQALSQALTDEAKKSGQGSTSVLGQTRKIRACLRHVRFTPLSGRMLRRVPTSAMGQERMSGPRRQGVVF